MLITPLLFDYSYKGYSYTLQRRHLSLTIISIISIRPHWTQKTVFAEPALKLKVMQYLITGVDGSLGRHHLCTS